MPCTLAVWIIVTSVTSPVPFREGLLGTILCSQLWVGWIFNLPGIFLEVKESPAPEALVPTPTSDNPQGICPF